MAATLKVHNDMLEMSTLISQRPPYSWRNGTRCRDDVKLLWCDSHLVWLVLKVCAKVLGSPTVYAPVDK